MAGPFKMKNPLLSKSVKTGESIAGNFTSPARNASPTKQYSEKIGPANKPGKTKELRRAAAAVPLGDEYDAEYDKKYADYKESQSYEKTKKAPVPPLKQKVKKTKYSEGGHGGKSSKVETTVSKKGFEDIGYDKAYSHDWDTGETTKTTRGGKRVVTWNADGTKTITKKNYKGGDKDKTIVKTKKSKRGQKRAISKAQGYKVRSNKEIQENAPKKYLRGYKHLKKD